MPRGDGVAVLLYAQLLELGELAAAAHEGEAAAGPVHAAVLAGAAQQRHEGGAADGLVGLGAALIAGVGRHLHHRLHLRTPGHDTLNRNTSLSDT